MHAADVFEYEQEARAAVNAPDPPYLEHEIRNSLLPANDDEGV